jgi:hypothetical protein
MVVQGLGFCSTFMTVTGAVAGKCFTTPKVNSPIGCFTGLHFGVGAISGVAGGAFSLLGLICQAA